MKQFELAIKDLPCLVQKVLDKLKNGGVIVLQGNLASGKTTFVSSFAKEFGIQEVVTSPTFSLQQQYGENIYHYDIYNKGTKHFIALGMLEELEKEGYHFIEWGDNALTELLLAIEIPFITIEIEKLDDKRLYKVSDAYIKSR